MTTLASLTGATALGLALVAGPVAAQGWEPQKPVELIIMAGTGGGADQLARLLAGLIEQKDLSPVPFVPINKPGGSGAEALRYIQDAAGDPHVVLVTLNSFYTTPILQENLGVDITSFTPIGRMALDRFVLWVNADTDIETMDEYIAAAKEAGKDWKMGGTGSGQEDSIVTAMLEAETGIDVTYIPFPGGGTVAQNLVGAHIDGSVNNPAEQIEFWRAGNTRPIVQFTGERMDIFPDVPTAQEAGVDIEYYMQRSINGPPEMPEEAQQWYMDLFHTLYQSPEWQEYCASEGLNCTEWVAGDELMAFHEDQYARHQKLIDKVGASALTGE
ncbi:MAG TPA: tripartite tricarboxylate transporter substrate binding protein [Paracoccaceae bacterium]|nr:tripartite tricarboxylate transporter substrate binding protein [Paracoccaceae bacterium]